MFIHIVPYCIIYFLRLNNVSLYAYATFGLSIYLHVDTWVASTFQLLNSVAMNIYVKISLQDLAFNSFESIPRSRVLVSCGSFSFNILKSH